MHANTKTSWDEKFFMRTAENSIRRGKDALPGQRVHRASPCTFHTWGGSTRRAAPTLRCLADESKYRACARLRRFPAGACREDGNQHSFAIHLDLPTVFLLGEPDGVPEARDFRKVFLVTFGETIARDIC